MREQYSRLVGEVAALRLQLPMVLTGLESIRMAVQPVWAEVALVREQLLRIHAANGRRERAALV